MEKNWSGKWSYCGTLERFGDSDYYPSIIYKSLLNAEDLRQIADKLDDLNAPADDITLNLYALNNGYHPIK
jgi:hypothetical protein